MNRIEEIDSLIEEVEKKLIQIDEQRAIILNHLDELKQQRQFLISEVTSHRTPQADQTSISNRSSENDKIALFRSLFRGREDVFARRFESAKTGKSGYQPCCRNEWVTCGYFFLNQLKQGWLESWELSLLKKKFCRGKNLLYIEKNILPPVLRNRLIWTLIILQILLYKRIPSVFQFPRVSPADQRQGRPG